MCKKTKNPPMTEEEYKYQIRSSDPFYADEDGKKWRYVGKYDLVSPSGDMVIEVKPRDSVSVARIIFQSILTAIKAGRTHNFYGCHTPTHKKCVPSYAIDRRLLELDNIKKEIKPSDTSCPINTAMFKQYEQCIINNLRDFPEREEREKVIKAKELHFKITDEKFNRLKSKTPSLFPSEEEDLLLETEKWRIDPSDREQLNAYYTPPAVVEQVKDLVNKHWGGKFDQIWDCAAGDGHLVNWYDNVILSDISPKITFHNGFVLDYLSLNEKSLKEFKFSKDGIIIVNPSYKKGHIKHLISFAEKNKLRMCIFAPGSLLPVKKMPVVDGFFSGGWGNGGGSKERGQLIVLLDFTGNYSDVEKITFSDGTTFECIPNEHAIKTGRGYLRYCCVAADSMTVSNERGVNLFATCGKNPKVAGCFLSSKIDNYVVKRNKNGSSHGYKKRKVK